jgi:hypothetical protein
MTVVFRRFSTLVGVLAWQLAWCATATLSAEDATVVIADDWAELDPPLWDDSAAEEVVPAQFQARSRSSAARSRTSTRQAAMSGGGRSAQIDSLRLANTPKMMGDFFNLPGQTSVVGAPISIGGQGLAIHQAIESGAPFADNNIAIITTDPGTQRTVFLGGPGGLDPGTFFLPSIPTAQLQNPQTGLQLDGDNVNYYTAVLNGSTADVYSNPADSDPSFPNAPVYQMFIVSNMMVVGPNPGDIVGRVRIQDNNNALPTDRIFFDYNYYHNVPFTANGIDVNRFTPGFEKTFLDGLGSVEVRVPMAVSYNSTQYLGAGPDVSNAEFGNMAIIPKILLLSNDEMALAAGLGIALPTANDIRVYSQAGEQVLNVDNDSVHLIPFLGYMFAPRDGDCFFLSFLTLDTGVNGNDVTAATGTGGLSQIGIWNDQTLLSASGTFGKYLFQNYSGESLVQSISLLGELHYTAAVSDADTINAGAYLLGQAGHDLSLLNSTVGLNARFINNSTLTTGYTVPLTSSDRIFDGELRVFINQFF